jgi:DNA-binding winged helix-turn-helix (wHTH) protein
MLYKNGTTVSLKPKVVGTLVALVERSGEVISKEELMNCLWPDSFVEDANLSQNIYLLRKTLGNGASGQPMIETFWRRGYRFNGDVRQSGDLELLFATHTKTLVVTEEETVEDLLERDDVSEIKRETSRLPKMSVKLSTGAVVLTSGLLLIASAASFFQFRSKTNPPKNANSARSFSILKMSRLTPDLNIQSTAISPDGKYLAYDWADDRRHSLWLKDIASGGTSQIGPPMDNAYFDLSFSPDGAYIYYNTSQKNRPNRTILRLPATGGEPQEIAHDALGPITFSPDQRRIAFVRGPLKKTSVILANADGSGDEQELITSILRW